VTKIIGVISGKGGVGKTTVSANLALALKKFGKKVIVVDCNLSTPHLAYYLGVSDYKYTLNDVLIGNVEMISSVSMCDGIRYVPASLQMSDLSGISLSNFEKHLKTLVNPDKVDYIILDSAPGLGKEALTVLTSCDEVVFVTTPFAPMINDVMRCQDVLRKIKGTKTLGIVLTMTTGGLHEMSAQGVAKITGVPVIGEIPYDKNVTYGMVSKSPIISYSPDSLASIGFMQLAASLTGKEYVVPAKMRMHKLVARLKNTLLPSKVVMPKSVQAIKQDIFIENK
jgi:septum site-determining protein MinD